MSITFYVFDPPVLKAIFIFLSYVVGRTKKIR